MGKCDLILIFFFKPNPISELLCFLGGFLFVCLCLFCCFLLLFVLLVVLLLSLFVFWFFNGGGGGVVAVFCVCGFFLGGVIILCWGVL